MELYLFSKDGKLIPTDDEGREWVAKKTGKTVKAEVTEPRNLGHHRKFFAMIGIIERNQERYSKDEIVNLLKLGIGHVHIVQTDRGPVRWPASISWAKMDQAQFDDFYNRAVNWVLQTLIPMAREDLDAAVTEELLRF